MNGFMALSFNFKPDSSEHVAVSREVKRMAGLSYPKTTSSHFQTKNLSVFLTFLTQQTLLILHQCFGFSTTLSLYQQITILWHKQYCTKPTLEEWQIMAG